MEIILSAYEKRTINFSGGYFTVLSINGDVELSAKGIEDIPIETGDQINLGDVAKFVLQNITGSSVIIKYTSSSSVVNKKAQITRAEIINTSPIEVHFDEAFTIGAVNQNGEWNIHTKASSNTAHKPRVNCIAGQVTLLIAANERKSVRLNIRADQFAGVTLGNDNT